MSASNRMSLVDLYQAHAGKVSDKWASYLAVYNRIFDAYRDKPIQLLEIGTQNGGSLEIWSYYFENAKRLVGCDIDEKCRQLTYDDTRIAVVVGDACLDLIQDHISTISPSFDIIIDDGSHRSGDIVRCFAKFFPKLSTGGVYVAEDLHCSYWTDFDGGLHYPLSSISFFKGLVDILNHEHWGIPERRHELLGEFEAHYGILIDDDVLSSIESLEFANSICIIRRGATNANALGQRVVAGTTASVVKVAAGLNGSTMSFPPQPGNSWLSQDEDHRGDTDAATHKSYLAPDPKVSLAVQLAQRDMQISKLTGKLRALETSEFWRLTAPARHIVQILKKLR